MADFVNLLAIAFSIGTFLFAVLIYQKVRYKPLIFLILQCISGILLRVLIELGLVDRGSIMNTSLLLLFYSSMFLASFFLYRTIVVVLHGR